MFCPECKAQTRVLRTMTLESPRKVIRNRVCRNCGYQFCTQETADEPEKPRPNPYPLSDR